MWTNENRGQYDPSKRRYPIDLTDDESAWVTPLISSAKRGGNKRTVFMRNVVDVLVYILSTGCQWRAIPKDLAPRCTATFFFRWRHHGTLDGIDQALYV